MGEMEDRKKPIPKGNESSHRVNLTLSDGLPNHNHGNLRIQRRGFHRHQFGDREYPTPGKALFYTRPGRPCLNAQDIAILNR